MDRLQFLERMLIKIIQGGMGVGISSPELARIVSMLGGMGVVSAVANDDMLVRELQLGDPTEEIFRAMQDYPDQNYVDRVWERFYVKGGKKPTDDFKRGPFFTGFKQDKIDRTRLSLHSHPTDLKKDLEGMIMLGTFVEARRAMLDENGKEHGGFLGINFLDKLRAFNLPGQYMAQFNNYAAIIVGAGFPSGQAEALDGMTRGEEVSMPLPVEDVKKDADGTKKEYRIFFQPPFGEVNRSAYAGIISTHGGVKGMPDVDFYIGEKPKISGGHIMNARGGGITYEGEPIWSEIDEMDIPRIKRMIERNHNRELEENLQAVKKPFFLAGFYASKLTQAIEEGAVGVQLGSVFAFCQNSGMDPKIRMKALEEIAEGLEVKTDPNISPTGYTFQVLQQAESIANPQVYNDRKRVCDIGKLLIPYEKPNGDIGLRCSAMPTDTYVQRGGKIEDTVDKGCLCNGLITTRGQGTPGEPALITAGKVLDDVKELINIHGLEFYAEDVINYVVNKTT